MLQVSTQFGTQGLVAIFFIIIFHIIYDYDGIIIYNMKNDDEKKYCYKSLWFGTSTFETSQ